MSVTLAHAECIYVYAESTQHTAHNTQQQAREFVTQIYVTQIYNTQQQAREFVTQIYVAHNRR
jgi:hypothetical protein